MHKPTYRRCSRLFQTGGPPRPKFYLGGGGYPPLPDPNHQSYHVPNFQIAKQAYLTMTMHDGLTSVIVIPPRWLHRLLHDSNSSHTAEEGTYHYWILIFSQTRIFQFQREQAYERGTTWSTQLGRQDMIDDWSGLSLALVLPMHGGTSP